VCPFRWCVSLTRRYTGFIYLKVVDKEYRIAEAYHLVTECWI